jgi:predicted outer membrane repeat protein
MDRFIRSSLVSSGGNDVGAGAYTYSVDLQQSATNVSYVWKVDGVQVSTAATYSATWTNTDEHLITVELTDDVLGCTKTLSHVHHKLPDNMSDADCYIPAPAMTWGIKQDWSSSPIVLNRINPLVGDLDNNGIPEIVCFGSANSRILTTSPYQIEVVNTILIYNGKTYELIKTITLPQYITTFDGSPYGLVKSHDGTGLIVVADIDCKLRAYDITGTEKWVSDTDFGLYANADFAVNIGFADFNNDGYPEVYVRNKIYDASSGVLLATATGGNNTGLSWTHYPHVTKYKFSSVIAADVTGDEKLELILGNEIYSVNITNRLGTVDNSITMTKTVNPAGVTTDGHAQVADFNNDGHLDILVSNRDTRAETGGTVAVYVWDVYNDAVSTPLLISTTWNGKSIPLIADVNNNGKLDIVIMCDKTSSDDDIQAYEYNSATRQFSYLWGIDPDENSYSNSVTLFDFNFDGSNEMLISDQSKVRIFNGNDASLIASFDITQNTIMQYPVIADVDGDGSADILAVGYPTGHDWTGSLNVLKSSGSPWAPARKVWNQYMYNAVNINEDLTVPSVQLNPVTVFPGADGLLGTSDDVRPYNNFLQQQTALDKNGIPLWLTPDAKFTETPVFTYYGDGDSLVIVTELTNTGDAPLIAPFYISAYKNDATIPANKMATDSSMVSLNVDDIMATTVTIRNYSSYASLTKIIIRINDKGEAAYVQLECDYDNNTFEYDPAGLPKAANDTVATLINTEVTIDVRFNDTPASGCPSLEFTIATDPTKGVADLVGDQIKYTSQTDFYGVDSLVYRLTCTTGKTEAKVYIIVNKPIAATYIGCAGTNVIAGFETITDVEYLWYTVETGGSPDGGVMNTRPCVAPSEWWVEAQYKGKPVAPRLKVVIDAYPALTAVSIEKDYTICYGTIPVQLKATNNPSGGNGFYSYRWQQSSNGVDGWTDTDSTDRTFTLPTLTSDTYYRLNTTSCTTEPSNVVKITVRSLRSALVSSGGNDVGAGVYTYSVDLQQSATNVSYVWKVDGAQVSTDATYSATWTNADEHLITVELTDDVLGCTKTLSITHDKCIGANGRVYVTTSGAGNMDGSSWANAYAGLADPLLAAAQTNCQAIKEIWVARGTYHPLHRAGNGTSEHDNSFVMVAGVKIYGGFAGTETSLTERNLAQNPSILSGDNLYHTVISAGNMISGTDTARLDGFVIRNGKANGSGTITVNSQSISANSGGGIYFANSSPNIVNVAIRGSEATEYGGGIYSNNSSPKLINVVVSGNLSASGGGIYLNGGSPALTNITVSGNRATTSGGGIYTNNSSPQIGNSIVWGNAAGSSNNVHSTGGSPAYQYSLIQDLNPSGAGNMDGTNPSNDPVFVLPIPASSAPTIDGYYRPQLGSPALNAGNNALNREPTDIESYQRIQESQIELGAYEVNYNFECNCE